MKRTRRLMNTLLQGLSSASLFLERLIANMIFCVPDNEIAELEEKEAVLCKDFDKIMTKSNSNAATYHTLVQRHAACERSIKELTASGNSNTVINKVQLLQNDKAQIEQRMVEVEDAQCLIWERTQLMHLLRK